MMKLLEQTKEGLIVSALMQRALRYSELKRETGLSDAWLSKKLRELSEAGVVKCRDGVYMLNPVGFRSALTQNKFYYAQLMALDLAKREDVLAVILFGSLARNPMSGGDIDLLVVTRSGSQLDGIGESVRLFDRYGVAVDIVPVAFRGLLRWFLEGSPLLLSILRSHAVLFDSGGFARLLDLMASEAAVEWTYADEVGAWLRK